MNAIITIISIISIMTIMMMNAMIKIISYEMENNILMNVMTTIISVNSIMAIFSIIAFMKIKAKSRSLVYARLSLRSAHHRHQRKFVDARVCGGVGQTFVKTFVMIAIIA